MGDAPGLAKPRRTGPRLPRRRALSLMLAGAGAALGASAAACGDPSPDPDMSALVTASEFLVGENRFPFRIVTNQGGTFAKARVHARFYMLDDERSAPRFTAEATYREAPFSIPHVHADGSVHDHGAVRRFFTVDAARFDRAGIWWVEFTVRPDGRDAFRVEAGFTVKTESNAPLPGERVPAVRNATRHDVADLSEITTASEPVEGMYELSVAEALEAGAPFVVAFSTPLFCATRMCGPVTEVVAELFPHYADRVNFIHVEPFDLPTARSDGRLIPAAATSQWGIETEPWVFVMDRDGRVATRIEGILALEELELAIESVLAGSGTTG